MTVLHKVLKVFFYTIGSFLVIVLLATAILFLFKEKIINLTITEINKNLQAKVEIDPEINLTIFEKFPEISIEFKKVIIYESYPHSQLPLGKAEKLYLSFKPFDFIQGKYVINTLHLENGSFHLRTDKKGNINYDIIRTDSTSVEGGVDFKLEEITLDSILVIYADEKRNQQYSILSRNIDAKLHLANENYLIGLKGELLIHALIINGQEYFQEKEISISSEQAYYSKEDKYEILPSIVMVGKSEFTVQGYHKFNEGKNYIDFHVKERGGNIQTLLSLLPGNVQKEFKAYKSKGDIFFNGIVKGYITENENPIINIAFGFHNCSFYHPDLEKQIEQASMSGTFSNGNKKQASTSRLDLRDVVFTLNKRKISGSFAMENFIQPFLNIAVNGSLDLRSAYDFYPHSDFKNVSGSAAFDVLFEGKMEDLKSKEGLQRIKTSGQLLLEKLSFDYVPQSKKFTSWNGTLLFNNNDIALDRLNGKIGLSDLSFTGIFRNVLSSLVYNKTILIVEGDLKSNLIDLDDILKVNQDIDLKVVPAGQINDTESGHVNLIRKYRVNVSSEIKTFKYERYYLKNIKGDLIFSDPEYYFRNISFNFAGGKIEFNAKASWKNNKIFHTNSDITFKEINIDTVFYTFNDFDQDFISGKNLNGKLSGNLKIMVNLNEKGEPDFNSIIADAELSIKNGELINFEPMKKMSRFIEEKELEHIKFSELKNRIMIDNGKITIPDMNIKSNVSDISIMGTHTFDNEMDYRLTVPLKNFKREKADKDAAFGAIEKDNKGNTLIFLTIKGTADNFKVAYDSKSTKQKIKEDIKNEKKEFEDLFKKKNSEPQNTIYITPSQEEFFEFD